MLSGPNHPSNETQWVIRIRHIIEDELEEDGDLSPSIAGVPKPLLSTKPEAYVPQLIALGPYHHSQEEHELERYKLSAAKKIRIRLPNIAFQDLVDLFLKVEYRIRTHYHRYLPFRGETLAWMMAIDASFLLEFFQIYTTDEPQISLRIPSRAHRSVHSTRRTSTHDMLLRDIIMLENQIPLFLLLKILELQFSSPQLAKEALTLMLIGFLKEISPFKMIAKFQSFDIKQHSHLIDLLYHSIVPHSVEELVDHPIELGDDHNNRMNKSSNYIKCFFNAIRVFILARSKSFILGLIKFLVKIPWRMVTSLPAISVLKQSVEHLFFSQMDPNTKPSIEMASQGLSIEEIAIPSVTELASAGIRFEPTNGDISSSVAFDAKTATLHLPEISLDVNSEVVVRNLVAYETAIKSGPLVFTRYVELMNGIIDTEGDAKLLRERGVVVNRLRSDGEVAELWNGMSRSVRLTRVRVLDEVIAEVNAYYNGRWRVKVKRFVKNYVVSSWESWVFVVVLVLLLVVGLQAFSTGLGFGDWAHGRRRGP